MSDRLSGKRVAVLGLARFLAGAEAEQWSATCATGGDGRSGQKVVGLQ